MHEILHKHFDPTFDRVIITAPGSLEEFVQEMKEAEAEEAKYRDES